MATKSKELMKKILIPAKWSNENCWLWLGALHPQNNTPIYTDHKKLLSPRRIMWHAYNPNEKLELRKDVVIPSCGIVECLNPFHLIKLSSKEFINTDIRCLESHVETSERTKEIFSLITHCPKGHEYTATNTGYDIKRVAFGKPSDKSFKCRYCKTCKADRALEYRRRRKSGKLS